LVRIKVMVDVPPLEIVVGLNALAMVGGASTVRFTVDEADPRVVCVVVTPLVMFGFTPGVLEVTRTVTVQLPLAGIVIPLKVRLVAPLAKLFVPAPVQVPSAFCAPLIAMFARVSVNDAAVRLIELVFVRVNVIVDVSEDEIVAGLNALAIEGLASTVRSTDVDGDPTVVSAVVTPLVLLGCTPGTVDVTSTVTVQFPPDGMVIPLNVRLVAPSVKELVPAPVQVPPAVCAPLIDISLSVSVKVAEVRLMAFKLASVKVMVDVSPVLIVDGLKAFEMVAFASTVRSTELEGVPRVVSFVVTPLVTFGFVPTVDEVTSTVTVQLPLAGNVMPEKERFVAPLTNPLELAPVHVPEAFCAPLIAILVNVSVKEAFVRLLVYVFVSVNVMVEVPPSVIVAGLNALAIVGRAMTVRLTVDDGEPTVVSLVVTPLAVFGFAPSCVEVTTMVTVQVTLLAGMVIPEKLSEPVAPSVKLLDEAPVQVPPAFCAPLTEMLVNVSVNDAPVNTVELELVRVKVMVDVPPEVIAAGLNAFTIVGFASTVRFTVPEPVPTIV
jgi:hypothetical protein